MSAARGSIRARMATHSKATTTVPTRRALIEDRSYERNNPGTDRHSETLHQRRHDGPRPGRRVAQSQARRVRRDYGPLRLRQVDLDERSEERRVGKECRTRGWPYSVKTI